MTADKVYKTLRKTVSANRWAILGSIVLIQSILSNYLAFLVRFEFAVPLPYFRQFLLYLPALMVIRLFLYFSTGLHKGMLRYASLYDMLKIIKWSTAGSCLFIVIIRYVLHNGSYPTSIFLLDCLFYIILSGGTRLFFRILREYLHFSPSDKRILIIGAGDAGAMIVRTMKDNNRPAYEPIGFIDDDITRKGLTIQGIPVLGPPTMLPQIIEEHRPDEILISDPASMRKTIREVYELSKKFNIAVKKLPGIDDLLDGNISVTSKMGQHLVDCAMVTEDQVQEALTLQQKEGGRLGSKLVKLGHITEEQLMAALNKYCGISHMRPISLEDLLRRDTIRTDIESVRNLIKDKSVMITGAGGSIGSELSRQIHKYGPSQLILLDRYENNLYSIDIELRNRQKEVDIAAVIGDVQDNQDIDHIFDRYKPRIVFHAAAYKHVPLMEHNPIVAVKNNIFGTRNLLESAAKHNAERFVMISTDKAVNPSSVMGATKRVAEFLTSSMNGNCSTRFTSVRFGNVLGTNGSVLPVFREQLKKGGPLTVTHPEIKRFFMLIPEAVQLVLIASAAGNGGEIFVLDMGDQIKIIDLAENFVRLSGFIPHKEIKIEFTGLRPGEKLYEELFEKSERIVRTSHEKLRMVIPEVPSVAVLHDHLAALEQSVETYAVEEVLSELQKIVPGFRGEGLGRSYPELIDSAVHDTFEAELSPSPL